MAAWHEPRRPRRKSAARNWPWTILLIAEVVGILAMLHWNIHA